MCMCVCCSAVQVVLVDGDYVVSNPHRSMSSVRMAVLNSTRVPASPSSSHTWYAQTVQCFDLRVHALQCNATHSVDQLFPRQTFCASLNTGLVLGMRIHNDCMFLVAPGRCGYVVDMFVLNHIALILDNATACVWGVLFVVSPCRTLSKSMTQLCLKSTELRSLKHETLASAPCYSMQPDFMQSAGNLRSTTPVDVSPDPVRPLSAAVLRQAKQELEQDVAFLQIMRSLKQLYEGLVRVRKVGRFEWLH